MQVIDHADNTSKLSKKDIMLSSVKSDIVDCTMYLRPKVANPWITILILRDIMKISDEMISIVILYIHEGGDIRCQFDRIQKILPTCRYCYLEPIGHGYTMSYDFTVICKVIIGKYHTRHKNGNSRYENYNDDFKYGYIIHEHLVKSIKLNLLPFSAIKVFESQMQYNLQLYVNKQAVIIKNKRIIQVIVNDCDNYLIAIKKRTVDLDRWLRQYRLPITV